MIIDQEFKMLIPPLTQEEYQGLENSLLAEGCRDSLTIWKEEDILLDGHNRYEICQKHNLLYQIKYISLPDRTSAEIWIIGNQLNRRNLSNYQRSELALKYETRLKEKAKENQGTRTDIPQNSAECLQPIETREELAKVAGVSHDTIHKVKIIQEQGIESLKDMARSEEISINAASIIAKAPEEEQQTILALPQKERLIKVQELAAQYKAQRDAAEKREQEKQMTITTLEDRIITLEEDRSRFEKDRTRMEENLTRVRAENDQVRRNKAADDACIIRQEENYRQKLEEIEKGNRQIEELTKQIEELKSQMAAPQTIEKEVRVEVEKRIEVIPEDYEQIKEKLKNTSEELDELTKRLKRKEKLLSTFDKEQKQAKGLQKINDGMKYVEEAYILLKDQYLDECVQKIIEEGLQSLTRLFHNVFERQKNGQN